MKKLMSIVTAIALLLVIGLVVLSGCQDGKDNANAQENPAVTTIVTGLEVPWSLDFLPDGSIIFTERPGRIRLVGADGNLQDGPLLTLDNVTAVGEGGLLGIAVHPDFADNGWVYVYYTYEENGELFNRVSRFTMQNMALSGEEPIIEGIPGAANHDGGRIKFGPDGLLYATTGDAGDEKNAQDLGSLAGKILRLKDDGSVPADNPFTGSPVCTYGHRNPEGLAWDDQGRLWSTEHGSSATDELNLIEPGNNYGWPVIRGDETREGMVSPVIHSGSTTWAPSGLAYSEGAVYFTGLRGQTLYRVSVQGDDYGEMTGEFLQDEYGRLRAAVIGPDGFLYVLTSNRDGRGSPAPEDDRLLRIDISGLES